MFLAYLSFVLTFVFFYIIGFVDIAFFGNTKSYFGGYNNLKIFYPVLVISFVIFVVYGVVFLKNYSKIGFYQSLKSENSKIFFLSFGTLIFGILFFGTNILFGYNSILKQNAQQVGQLEYVWQDGTHHYAWGEKGNRGPNFENLNKK